MNTNTVTVNTKIYCTRPALPGQEEVASTAQRQSTGHPVEEGRPDTEAAIEQITVRSNEQPWILVKRHGLTTTRMESDSKVCDKLTHVTRGEEPVRSTNKNQVAEENRGVFHRQSAYFENNPIVVEI